MSHSWVKYRLLVVCTALDTYLESSIAFDASSLLKVTNANPLPVFMSKLITLPTQPSPSHKSRRYSPKSRSDMVSGIPPKNSFGSAVFDRVGILSVEIQGLEVAVFFPHGPP